MDVLGDCRKRCPLWVSPFPRKGIWDCIKSGRSKQSSHQQASLSFLIDGVGPGCFCQSQQKRSQDTPSSEVALPTQQPSVRAPVGGLVYCLPHPATLLSGFWVSICWSWKRLMGSEKRAELEWEVRLHGGFLQVMRTLWESQRP